MSNEMKLIMENWRKNTLNEGQFDTIGQVRKAIKAAIKVKKKEISWDTAKGAGAGIIVDLIPGAGTAIGVLDIVKSMYKLPDNEKTGTGLDNLNVDDMIAIIVDDGVENKFLSQHLAQYKGLPDNVPLVNVNMTNELLKFIKSEYHRTIKRT